MRAIATIFLLSVLFSVWAGYKSPQASVGNFSIRDTCGQCSGGIELILITNNSKGDRTSYLNNTIIESLTHEAADPEQYSIDDFENNRVFGDCLGLSITTLLNIHTHSILSLTSRCESTCGTSISQYFPEHHVTIDLDNNEPLSLENVIRKEQWENFEQFVIEYARKNKIDNVHYLSGDSEESKHDQRKITYLSGLRSDFYVKEGILGIYTLIDDQNPADRDRRLEEGIIGIEYMNVELPLSRTKKFIDPGTSISSLIAN